MSCHDTDFEGNVPDAIRQAIAEAIPDSTVEVDGGGGHYTIAVVSSAFADKNLLQRQRLVYSAIAHLMKGERAPVHAVDRMTTRAPD